MACRSAWFGTTGCSGDPTLDLSALVRLTRRHDGDRVTHPLERTERRRDVERRLRLLHAEDGVERCATHAHPVADVRPIGVVAARSDGCPRRSRRPGRRCGGRPPSEAPPSPARRHTRPSQRTAGSIGLHRGGASFTRMDVWIFYEEQVK